MNAVEIKGLTKRYGDFSLESIDLTLPGGCIIGLVGENGAGKSTTIKLMLDIIKKDGGSITVLGKDSRALDKEEVGVVLDEVGIPGCLTVAEVGKIMKASFKNWDQKEYEGYLSRFDLPQKKKFSAFSKGMKMKLGIAVALSHHPKLLILDEATSGLDPVVRDDILDIFAEFTREEEHSILISSHIVSDLEKICDYIAFLHKGKLLLCAEKDLLREQYGIIHLSGEEYRALPKDAVIGKKITPYGVEVIVKRESLPPDCAFSAVDIEQLFVFMIKEANDR